jgi:5-methylthioadenosine/S-adenosylhomocysteine deaminase
MLIRGGMVYDHDGDVHYPPVGDILITESDIVACGGDLLGEAGPDAEILDATGRLVVPGLVNAHYHSHDTLCRGLFEELPLEMWLLYTLPMGANRSMEEVRARTLVGAIESLRAGITTIQDMLGLVPFDEAYVDVVLAAYRDAGIRVVFSPMVSDIPAIGMVRYHELLPPPVREMLGSKALAMRPQLEFLEAQLRRHPAGDRLHWAVAPFAPQRCTAPMLEGCAALSERYGLPVFTHVYETKGQALIARDAFARFGGSLIAYLDSTGLLGPRLNIVHSVWISRAEMDRMAAADAGVVLNHLSNMKLKSGVAPVYDLRDSGVRLGLGCDNCSGSDVQNMFQAMKMFCLIAAVSEPEPGPGLAPEVLRYGTLGNARAIDLGGRIGAIRPGHKADLVLIDLRDTAYLPLNSAARQLVYSETGRGIETVIVDGRVVVKDRRVTTIDEEDLRREVADLMRHFIADYDAVVRSCKEAMACLLEAHRRVWQEDIGIERFLSRTR